MNIINIALLSITAFAEVSSVVNPIWVYQERDYTIQGNIGTITYELRNNVNYQLFIRKYEQLATENYGIRQNSYKSVIDYNVGNVHEYRIEIYNFIQIEVYNNWIDGYIYNINEIQGAKNENVAPNFIKSASYTTAYMDDSDWLDVLNQYESMTSSQFDVNKLYEQTSYDYVYYYNDLTDIASLIEDNYVREDTNDKNIVYQKMTSQGNTTDIYTLEGGQYITLYEKYIVSVDKTTMQGYTGMDLATWTLYLPKYLQARIDWYYETSGDIPIVPTEINYEIIDIGGLMLEILAMPFTFISQAFNFTAFPNTPYSINIANLFLTIMYALLLIFIIKLIINR